MHPAIEKGCVAIVTGSAVGIGYAIAERLAGQAMDVVLLDKDEVALRAAAKKLSSLHPGARVRTLAGDVTDDAALLRLRDTALDLGRVSLLVNNAAIIERAGPWETSEGWPRLMDINFWSILKLQQLFVPYMLALGGPAAVVNLGSKEGITTPPGNAAYAVSKAAVRILTEQLAHELREQTKGVTAHLLIPGYTFTPMNFPDMTDKTSKPAAPWSAAQVADRMLEGMASGQFYIFCEDNEVTRELDQRRMQWSADDLIQGRPALSRWHPDYREAFAAYVASASPKV